MKKLVLICLAALLLMTAAAAEWDPEGEFLFSDVVGVGMVTYNDVPWNFPIDMMEMDPALIRLVNKHVFLPDDFVPEDLADVKSPKFDADGGNTNGGVRYVDGPWKLQRDCLAALADLCDAARAEGHELYLKSGYRSYYKQAVMYENRLKKYGYDDGWVTKPGASDHQTGLGCDVVPRNWTDRGMNEDMAREEETQWMAENCARFGFILRYPADKEDITEINYEPWHLRYVGIPVATYIMDNGLTLEEFHVELQAAIEAFVVAGGPEFLVADFVQTSAEDKYR